MRRNQWTRSPECAAASQVGAVRRHLGTMHTFETVSLAGQPVTYEQIVLEE